MSNSVNRVALKVDASMFEKHAGDRVKKGEILGNFAGCDIEAPFNGIVGNVSFDPEDHTLAVVLLSISR